MLSYEEYKKVYNITQNEYIDGEKKIEKILKKRYTFKLHIPTKHILKLFKKNLRKNSKLTLISVFLIN